MQRRMFSRATALIALIAILFVMLFSALFISKHIHHDCAGADCPICAVMEQCSNNLRNIGTVAVIAACLFFLYFSVQKRPQPSETVVLGCSLISQKVRMNN